MVLTYKTDFYGGCLDTPEGAQNDLNAPLCLKGDVVYGWSLTNFNYDFSIILSNNARTTLIVLKFFKRPPLYENLSIF